mgnify:CR=1 FL=1
MKMLRRSVCLLLCAALFLTLLAGCGKQEEPAEDFVVSAAVCGPLETLDPTMNTDVGAESLLSTLFEGLMRMRDDGAGKAVAVAGIAKEYIEEKNYDDTVTYTFTLRDGPLFHNGEPVTAEDVLYSVELFRSMDIPVRQLECCSGDLADLKVKSCDIEAWSPRQQKYFEVCSCSNLGDAQARRLHIRIKGKDGKNYLAHTLNNTCVAPPRMLIAFLENNLQPDGSVVIPEVLRPYMGGKEVLVPKH